jgi:hypothetical protein
VVPKILKTHKVKKGETISGIALKHYGSNTRDKWIMIAEANPGVINPKTFLVRSGDTINIPEINMIKEKENNSMTAKKAPIHKKETSTAPLLSRNVPEPTSYTGNFYVKLPFREEDYFAPTKTNAPDYALKFSSVGKGVVEVDHNEKLAITGDRTICAWIYIDDLNGFFPVLQKTSGNNIGSGYSLWVVSGVVMVQVTRDKERDITIQTPTPCIAAGRWQHIAFSREGNLVKIFVNGEEKHQEEVDGIEDSGGPFQLATVGMIDQVQIWERAFSEDDFAIYMNSTISGYESGLVASWSMNDGTGKKVTDDSPNQLNGKIKGKVDWVFSNRSLNQSMQVKVDEQTLNEKIEAALNEGEFDPNVFPEISAWITTEMERSTVVKMLNKEGKENLVAHYMAGERLRIFRSVAGGLSYDFVGDPSKVESSMFLIETYRLSSFLGAYGVGRTVKTFSLLPGEKSTISISTYKKSKETASSASSIFDSYNQESANDFSNEMANEQSDIIKSDDSLNWNVNAKVDASWGWGSAEVSGGASGSSNSSRESFGKRVSNVTSKHAAKASAKRDVQINTSSETETQQGEETAIQREIENINVSRTLNFIFRQMNQEYITLLHLVDVKIGFGTSGIPQSRRIVPLQELDNLIEEVIVNDKAKRKYVKDFIIGELANIRDYQDKTVSEHQEADPEYPDFLQRVSINNSEGKEVASYYRLRKDFTSTYNDPTTGSQFKTPGIIINADKIVMRTDDVLVDTLLGEGNALDAYSQGLQDQAVTTERVQNEFMDIRNELLRKILNAPDKDSAAEAAGRYQKIFGSVSDD